MLHSICPQIWKTQQWPQDWKRSIFIPIPKKDSDKECSNYCTVTAKSLQSCLTLSDPIDDSPPGFPIPARDVLQARTLEWVAISFSNAWKWNVKVKSLSHVWLLATPWTAAHQAPPSIGFSSQQYWSGVPLPSPMIQQMLAVWPLGPLPFLNPDCISESSCFMYRWSLAWRILSITWLACEMSIIVQ